MISNLAVGPLRFTELKRRVRGISQRMLTETLCGPEHDGMVTRTVFPTIPPKLEYALRPLGESLLEPMQALVRWSVNHREIGATRQSYDARDCD